MPKINVLKPFKLLLTPIEMLSFEPGVQDVSEDVADHWYTKDHSEPVDGDHAPAEAAQAAAGDADDAGDDNSADEANDPDAAEKAAIRAKLVELGAPTPHYRAGLPKLREALTAAEAAQAAVPEAQV